MFKIGQVYNRECREICTLDGHDITWSNSIIYLGVYIKSAKNFTCCLSLAKGSFYRAFNAVLGKVANVASEL